MPKILISQNPAVDPALIALTPRQVLLANPNTMKNPRTGKASSGALTSDQKALLLEAVAHFLDRNGFSKTLKKFRSEAQVEKDGLKDSTLDLEEIYYKYLEMWDHSNTKFKNQKEQYKKTDDPIKRDVEHDSTVALETGRKKNKKSTESDKCDVVSQSVATAKLLDSKNSKEKITNGAAPEYVRYKDTKKGSKIYDSLVQGTESLMEEPDHDKKIKEKKKKKSKSDSGSFVNCIEHHQLESQAVVTEEKSKEMVPSVGQRVGGSDTEKRSKDKKKKKDKPISDSLDDARQSGLDHKQGVVTTKFKDVQCSRDPQVNNSGSTPKESSVKSKSKKKKEDGSVSENLLGGNSKDLEIDVNGKKSKNNECKTLDEDVANNEKKSSKKRKRLASEESDFQPVDKKAAEELKRLKVEGSEESERSEEQQAKENASLGSDKSADKANGNLEKNGAKPAFQKIMKQCNGSVEPKTVTAFQRVKADEVVFTDERLKDNSYWAKNGAETGYGAKAQEILGQVRGRDFRHEKTKKKRGTYRGGQIDLHSYSVKFNYSDDE